MFRFLFKRLIYGKRFSSGLIQRISVLSSVELYGHGSMKLGHNLFVGPGSSLLVTGSGSLEIGDRSYFNRGCMISCHQKVVIENGCVFGPDVKIYDNDHYYSENGIDLSRHKLGDVVIGEGTWVAANAVILRGTHIGKHCVIGAGAVVKGTISDHSKVVQERKLVITPIV